MSNIIGREIRLEDGAPKVQGLLEFGGDLRRQHQLHARLVTSPHAHAILGSVDTSAAHLPGVHSILTGKDLPEIPSTSRATLLLARNRVRFVGHPVALVLAESEQLAQDAADLVEVDYEVQLSVTDLEASLLGSAAPVWPEGMPGQSAEAAAHGAAGGGAGAKISSSPNLAGSTQFERGDLEQGFAEADHIVDRTYRTASVHQSYIEPHITIAEFDRTGDELTVWTSTQAVHYVRDAVAAILRMDVSRVRVVGTPVGGGFGAKFLLYEPLVALAAKLSGRPVVFAMHRLEEMIAATPAPATRVKVRIGATREGKFTALDAELIMDCGCFPSSMSILGGLLLGSSYQIHNQRVSGIEVLTHRPSTGAYRAPAAPQCAFGLESAIDELAQELNLDPLELRLNNASQPGDPMAMETPWPAMGFTEVLQALQKHPMWRNREQARAKGRGVGLAIGAWPGGTEPAAAACSLQGDGVLQVHVGSVDLTGTRTAFQQIAAETFGLEPKDVRIISGDTQAGPFAGSTGGSKITYTVGAAVSKAVEEAKRQLLDLASDVLEAAPEDLEIYDRNVRVKGAPTTAIPLATLARKTMAFGSKQAPIYGQGRHAQPEQAPGFCGQIAEVEIDPETGAITVAKLLLVQDVGKAINPLLVRGQMEGGALQGLGWALLEELHYDSDGQPLTATLADYAIPHIAQLPKELLVECVEVPSPHGPFGARGVGEPPVIATAAAVANAVSDLWQVRPEVIPMTPERLLALKTQSSD